MQAETGLFTVRTGRGSQYARLPKDMVCAPGTFTGTPQELAALVLQQVETFPQYHDQNSWVGHYESTPDAVGTCGTTLCVAGWTQLFTTGEVGMCDLIGKAGDLLGLDEDSADDLFHLSERQVKSALAILAAGKSVNWDAYYNVGIVEASEA